MISREHDCSSGGHTPISYKMIADNAEYQPTPEVEKELPILQIIGGKLTTVVRNKASGNYFSIQTDSLQFRVLKKFLEKPNSLLDSGELAKQLKYMGSDTRLPTMIFILRKHFSKILPDTDVISNMREGNKHYYRLNTEIEYLEPDRGQDQSDTTDRRVHNPTPRKSIQTNPFFTHPSLKGPSVIPERNDPPPVPIRHIDDAPKDYDARFPDISTSKPPTFHNEDFVRPDAWDEVVSDDMYASKNNPVNNMHEMINTESNPDGEEHLIDRTQDDNEQIINDLAKRGAINEALSTLSERQQHALRLRYGFYDGKTRTLEEIGEIMDVTRAGASVIVKTAIKKIINSSHVSRLKDLY